jgi:hypothetical protein
MFTVRLTCRFNRLRTSFSNIPERIEPEATLLSLYKMTEDVGQYMSRLYLLKF